MGRSMYLSEQADTEGIEMYKAIAEDYQAVAGKGITVEALAMGLETAHRQGHATNLSTPIAVAYYAAVKHGDL